MTDTQLPKKIFNTEKADYTTPSLFLGDEPGLFDTVNKHYPRIWEIYKEQKSNDWSEDEFKFHSCNADFKTCSPDVYDIMIKTLAWQWEADSVASRSIASVVSPFITSDELWAAWQRISDNEVIHAATYSEIVRNSFDDPKVILNEVLRVKEAVGRMETVSKALGDIYTTSHKYALGMVENDQETYNMAFLFPVAMLLLERISFMSSFAVTFTICETGLFGPIGKAVQKIAQDELECHVELDKAVILNELKTERGQKALEMLLPLIQKMVDEVTRTELGWNSYLFSEGRELVGMTKPLLDKWSLFNAGFVYDFIPGLVKPDDLEFPEKNPLKFMERWLDISKTQAAPQEEDHGQYRVGVLERDDANAEFDVNF